MNDRDTVIERYMETYEVFYGIRPTWMKLDEMSTEDIAFATRLIVSTESSLD